ncbi:MAG: SDR family oxidoreductase [Chloroflexota bacterium]|nr:MAG: SDR family oxidoreductase [Chloroflexota bacterium]
METGLAGKTVIVTGGNANIGKGIVLAFAAEGANVVIVARDQTQGLKVAANAKELGAPDALWVQADVLKLPEVEAMAQRTLDRFGKIDVLVNNVGGNVDFKPFVETAPDQWQREIELNLMSTLNCTRTVLPHMIQNHSGRIINIGSTAGLVGDSQCSVYSATKGAIHAFTKVLAKEVGCHGITVNAVCPWATMPDNPEEDTSTGSRYHPTLGFIIKRRASNPKGQSQLMRKCAVERSCARPAEIGAAAVYLASDAASFTTGHLLGVDGGTLLM